MVALQVRTPVIFLFFFIYLFAHLTTRLDPYLLLCWITPPLLHLPFPLPILGNSMMGLQVRAPIIFLLFSISWSVYLTRGLSLHYLINDIINPYTHSLYKEIENCPSCSLGIESTRRWLKDLCFSYNDEFLKGVYLLANIRFIALVFCNKHIYLLATTFYLADAEPDILLILIEKVCKSVTTSSSLTALVMGNSIWFENRFCFI